MKLIPLNRSDGTLHGHTQVSDEDYHYLGQFKWSVNSRGYVAGWYLLPGDAKRTKQLMHRVIMGTVGKRDGTHTDHIDHDVWNNQRSNLRVTAVAGNLGNQRLYDPEAKVRADSPYRGVTLRNGLWFGRCSINRVSTTLGPYATELEAAKNIALYRTLYSVESNLQDEEFTRGWTFTPPVEKLPQPVQYRGGFFFAYAPEPFGKYSTEEEALRAASTRTNFFEQRRQKWNEADEVERKRLADAKEAEKNERAVERAARRLEKSIAETERKERAAARELAWAIARAQREAIQAEREVQKEVRRRSAEELEHRRAERRALRAARAEQERLIKLRKAEERAALLANPFKTCRACQHEYPRNELYFYPRVDAKDGYRPQCIKCYRDRQP